MTTPPPMPDPSAPPALPSAPYPPQPHPAQQYPPQPHATPYAGAYPPAYVPSPIERPKFGLPWWALVAVIPFGVIRWIAAGPVVAARGLREGEAMGFRLGSVLWGLVFACAVAWGAFLIIGRRRGVAAAVFISVYGFFTPSAAPGSHWARRVRRR